jgi:acyl-CoA hydrolase
MTHPIRKVAVLGGRLIAIAAPQFREHLERAAHELRLLVSL